MNIYDEIITYNKDEVRPASESIDKQAQRDSFDRWILFCAGCFALVVFGLLFAYALLGWADAI